MEKRKETEQKLVVRRVIDADPHTLWDALTDQQVMQNWFFAGRDGWSAMVETDLKVGGSYKIDMYGPEDTYWHTGVYKEIVPHEKIVFSWNSQAVTDSVVTITLKETKEGTEVKLIHEFIPNKGMKIDHEKGWTQILTNLERVVTEQTA